MDKLPAKPRLASAAAVSGGSHSGVRGREVRIPTPDAMPPRRRTACPALCRRAAFPIDDSLRDRDRRTSRSVDGELIEFTSDHDGYGSSVRAHMVALDMHVWQNANQRGITNAIGHRGCILCGASR
jgi:hypothetical protein